MIQIKMRDSVDTLREGNLPLNYVILCGDVLEEPKFHHKTHDENIYRFVISIPRLNKSVSDVLPIEISDRVVDLSRIRLGDRIGVEGQYRSFNQVNSKSGKINLKLFVFVKDVTFFDNNDGEYTNYIRLVGHICKKPVYRKTPSGREISDIILAVNRVYGRSDYIPCIAWGRNARYTSNLLVGDKILIDGRVQSRKYVKKVNDGIEEHIVYEVSTFKVEKADEAISNN